MDVHESLQHILRSKEIFGDLFYAALFQRHPEFRPYFDGIDLHRQAVLLTIQLTVIDAYHRHRSPAAHQYLQFMGTKHHDRGVGKELYVPFRNMLLETMQRFHGNDWTAELAKDWQTAIDDAAAVMHEGYEHHFTV